MPCTFPAEANQFCWQVEAGVDLGAISREQAGAGESREAVAASLPPHSCKVGDPAFRKGSQWEVTHPYPRCSQRRRETAFHTIQVKEFLSLVNLS